MVNKNKKKKGIYFSKEDREKLEELTELDYDLGEPKEVLED